jgi:hypothetical protein
MLRDFVARISYVKPEITKSTGDARRSMRSSNGLWLFVIVLQLIL